MCNFVILFIKNITDIKIKYLNFMHHNFWLKFVCYTLMVLYEASVCGPSSVKLFLSPFLACFGSF